MKAPQVICTVAVLMLNSTAVAQQDSIVIDTQAFKEVEVVGDDGSTDYKMVEPGKVLPNDEIIYITTFKNAGGEPATDIVITDVIPNNSVYKDGSAFGAGTQISFSVDGGDSFAPADELQATNAQGDQIQARPGDYTHIRWVYTRPLEPGEESTVTFRTIIKDSAKERAEQQ